MVKTKEKEEQNRSRPAEGGREGGTEGSTSLLLAGAAAFLPHLFFIWQSSAVGRANRYFVSEVKNFLLGDPSWRN